MSKSQPQMTQMNADKKPSIEDLLKFLDMDIELAKGIDANNADLVPLQALRNLCLARLSAGWQTGLPDSDTTVLIRCEDLEYPLWPGWHDGACWLSADASQVEGKVLGWMHLETAAKLLDGEKV